MEAAIGPSLRWIAGNPPSGKARQSGEADAAYAARLAAGEPKAVRAFNARNLPVVLAIARRLLGDEAEAEDAAQDVFVKVWTRAGEWRPGRGARFDSWVGRIAINACYDRLRKRRETASGGDTPERPDPGARADQRLVAADGAVQIRDAIAGLPERQRLALELCHFQELSQAEAGEMMEISVEALESLLARARRTLKARLEGEGRDLIAALASARGEEG